ncbi:hypothetical protein AKO1_008199 [Acrasis kona]|uniref:Metal-dependent phosphohydrolase n=1 Tax=Acrasis kona TaxID=1008807 RepID=A0AAW2YNW7_9EUKA
MFNSTEILIESFVEQLKKGYERTYGGMHQNYGEIIVWAGRMATEIISSSDALYHNVEHTILVTLVGQEMLRGKHIKEGKVTPIDWLHCVISLVCHDIGYVKGVCKGDKVDEGIFATGVNGGTIKVEEGTTDASLTPYHVDRGKLFVEERFGGHIIIDSEIVKRNIEHTRFPVPKKGDNMDVHGYPALVRASDLIGQMADPRYLQKISNLFYEFEETGANKMLGYRNPGDLRKQYPSFYWNAVHPFISDGLKYLQLTQNGKSYVAGLYSNVFAVEHERAPLK